MLIGLIDFIVVNELLAIRSIDLRIKKLSLKLIVSRSPARKRLGMFSPLAQSTFRPKYAEEMCKQPSDWKRKRRRSRMKRGWRKVEEQLLRFCSRTGN